MLVPPPSAPRPAAAAAWRGIALGALALVALTATKLAFGEYIGQPTPFLLYFSAVLIAAWYGDVAAGLVTTVLAGVAGNLVFMEPRFTLSTTAPAMVATAVFMLEGAAISLITARLQGERRKSAHAVVEMATALDKLTAVLAGVGDGVTMQDAAGRLLYANDVGARMSGFASGAEMLRTPAPEILRRFEMLREDGSPFAADELPARVLMRGGTPAETTIRFRVRATGDERWAVVRANAVRDERGAVRFIVNAFSDITDKRRQDEALRLSHEWFATALRSIGDAVITTDEAGRVTFLNTVAETLTGWTNDEARGRPLGEIFRIFNESSREPVESPVDRVLREGGVVGLANHTVLVRRDGGEAAIDDSAAPIKTAAGVLVGVVLVFRDVSVQRRKDVRKAFLMRATAELNSSLDYERTLGTVARLAVPGIADWCAVDMREGDGFKRLAVAHVDAAKIALVGELERRYPTDKHAPTGVPNVLRTGEPEMIARIPAEMLDAAARDDEHKKLIRALSLGSYIAVPIKRGGAVSGVITLAMAESQRVYDEDDLAFAVALGERAAVAIENAALYRQAERLRGEAQAERDRLQTMIMAAPTAICVLKRDPELRFELLNEPYRARFAGRAREGGLVSDVALDVDNVVMLERVFDTGEPAHGHEQPITARFADGILTHYVSHSVQPLRDAAGRVDRVVIFAHDVTEQVLIRRRLEAARVEAELASRSKDEFLAMLGHELRNPLAPILTALQLMNLRAGGALERERSIIERQVRHVVRLVDDLLDVSRITRGKVDLAREVVEVGEVVAKAIEMSSPLVEQRAHELRLAVEPGLFVDGDPMRLSQIVANMVQNAAKYTEKGGHLDIRATHEDGQIVIAVRDDGMGIAPEMLPRVFELFVQERQALDRAQGGLGIGLAIVRSLVALHGGTVEAHSDGIGKGSEFIVRLPAARAPASRASRSDGVAATTPAAAGGERILLVDDNSDALELMATSLELVGYQTLRAADGPSALVLAERERPTIALLDIGLPVMDGYELARRLRETRGLERIRLIALTGYGQPSDRERSAAAGFDQHLVKPVTIEVVQAAIEALKQPA